MFRKLEPFLAQIWTIEDFRILEDNSIIYQFILFPYSQIFERIQDKGNSRLLFENASWFGFFDKTQKYNSFLENFCFRQQIRFMDNQFKKGPNLSSYSKKGDLKEFERVPIYLSHLSAQEIIGLLN